MTKPLLISLILLATGLSSNTTSHTTGIPFHNQGAERLAELNRYWEALGRSVQEGDFEAYKALYHQDAVVIFATGENKASLSIADALAGWKEDFTNTKSGKQKGSVTFRFSQRIGNKDTAHETGIFAYSSEDKAGKISTQFIHFEALLVNRDGKWLTTMEYQKDRATQEEWDALN